MRKPRSDSEWEKLSVVERDSCIAWLFEENKSYEDCAKRFHQFYQRPISVSTLKRGYQSCSQQRLLDRITSSRQNANQVVERLKQTPADVLQAMIGTIGQIVFDRCMETGEKVDPETIHSLTKLLLEARKQELEEQKIGLEVRRVQLLEKKAAALDKVKEQITDKGGITPETLRQIEQELKLL